MKNTGIAGGVMLTAPVLGGFEQEDKFDFPLIDLHVHTTDRFTIDHIMKIAKERNVQFGIVEHPASWAIKKRRRPEKLY
ncbi:MAG: hypothetical protein HC906_14190 [Bacteroidales bacterium]|nr:hypothetical protein [Bacteroidales bacterium]